MTGFFATLGEVFLFSTLLSIGLFVLFLFALILQIITLVYQGRRNQWVWFVLTLIFTPLWIFYWIVWLLNPKLKRKR